MLLESVTTPLKGHCIAIGIGIAIVLDKTPEFYLNLPEDSDSDSSMTSSFLDLEDFKLDVY